MYIKQMQRTISHGIDHVDRNTEEPHTAISELLHCSSQVGEWQWQAENFINDYKFLCNEKIARKHFNSLHAHAIATTREANRYLEEYVDSACPPLWLGKNLMRMITIFKNLMREQAMNRRDARSAADVLKHLARDGARLAQALSPADALKVVKLMDSVDKIVEENDLDVMHKTSTYEHYRSITLLTRRCACTTHRLGGENVVLAYTKAKEQCEKITANGDASPNKACEFISYLTSAMASVAEIADTDSENSHVIMMGVTNLITRAIETIADEAKELDAKGEAVAEYAAISDDLARCVDLLADASESACAAALDIFKHLGSAPTTTAAAAAASAAGASESKGDE
jgi:hypothetical protein